jgi:hypothetical protein
LEVLKWYFCGNFRYSKHLVDCTSEWMRDNVLKNTNKNNKLVEAAGIEPALLLSRTVACGSMLAECCYLFKKSQQLCL